MRSYFTPLTLLFGSFLTTIAQADTQLLVTTSANQGHRFNSLIQLLYASNKPYKTG